MQPELTDSTVITEEMIKRAEGYAPCDAAAAWLREAPRTWLDLKRYNSFWSMWFTIGYCQISMTERLTEADWILLEDMRRVG